VHALSLASGGRLAPIARSDAPAAAVAGLTAGQKDCLDASSAALLRQAPTGLVVTPVFYGSTLLALSPHSAIAAPYHRIDEGVVPVIDALSGTPDSAAAIFRARGVDYVAICSTSQESALLVEEAPHGLLAQLLAGATFPWLEPIPASGPTMLRLWRVAG
jgi:hypothetical protein